MPIIELLAVNDLSWPYAKPLPLDLSLSYQPLFTPGYFFSSIQVNFLTEQFCRYLPQDINSFLALRLSYVLVFVKFCQDQQLHQRGKSRTEPHKTSKTCAPAARTISRDLAQTKKSVRKSIYILVFSILQYIFVQIYKMCNICVPLQYNENIYQSITSLC
ncbi:Hypothetical_protein [Hexamita inflata]|uniref:Hypothetical_protein n=1 Tax=Hexamita inflata TaxID=28002 RepID=A0AA86QQU3_9EUKA|nr:Hypothetical protein HINF_LOCUS48972 [Hexamita inflata]